MSGRGGSRVGGLHLLTKRARLARVATTAAAEADASSATKNTAATAATGGRGRRRRTALDAGVADVAGSRTPVGRHNGTAQAASHAGTRAECRETSAAGGNVDRAVIDAQGSLLLNCLLLPPSWVAVEQAQLLLRLPIVGHFVLILASLLSKSTSAIVDPLVTVDLFSPGAGQGATAAAATVVLDGTDWGGTVEATRGKDEGAASGTGGGVDDRVYARLPRRFMTCQPSELARVRFPRSASRVLRGGERSSQGHVLVVTRAACLLPAYLDVVGRGAVGADRWL